MSVDLAKAKALKNALSRAFKSKGSAEEVMTIKQWMKKRHLMGKSKEPTEVIHYHGLNRPAKKTASLEKNANAATWLAKHWPALAAGTGLGAIGTYGAYEALKPKTVWEKIQSAMSDVPSYLAQAPYYFAQVPQMMNMMQPYMPPSSYGQGGYTPPAPMPMPAPPPSSQLAMTSYMPPSQQEMFPTEDMYAGQQGSDPYSQNLYY